MTNPDFKGMATGLPGTKQEAEDLKRLIPNGAYYADEKATKEPLLKCVRPRLVHVATHGFFEADQPDPSTRDSNERKVNPLLSLEFAYSTQPNINPLVRSGLLFAGASEAARRLTALEMAGADWEGTQLVTLSACDTGVGDVRDGEGIYGVRRAMVLTGAVAGVITLWKVNDTATSELMRLFYDRLIRKHQSREEALRLAQLALLNTRERSNPFFWAGFIATGKDGPLR